MQASTAIWIVSDPRPEHVAALNWLNESSNADFFLLKIEAIRIGNSLPAPLLTLIVGPTEEGKSIGRTKQEMSTHQQKCYKWWSELVRHPQATHHSDVPLGNERAVCKAGTETVTHRFNTQQEAIRAARGIARNREGEVLLYGRDSRIREHDSLGDDLIPQALTRL